MLRRFCELLILERPVQNTARKKIFSNKFFCFSGLAAAKFFFGPATWPAPNNIFNKKIYKWNEKNVKTKEGLGMTRIKC
ncbi:hypothetical protein BpHYR1_033439 [Brachionus plicatilis]|uniref:Uncharacterized protein n=1 Tax=Brachionus plicatilis TaxID=10195 RepID=A0A3M7RQG6_BRAPC|nr:hypothetical protein BpHYR1_033439 [Brachionus plicatilis]